VVGQAFKEAVVVPPWLHLSRRRKDTELPSASSASLMKRCARGGENRAQHVF
jgi:hypothetical protein